MTNSDLEKIQEIATEILLDIDRICQKYDIQYCLMYGTLLGAVRHGGIIPWDDDIDIAMTRENYKTFLSVVYSELDKRNEVHIQGSGSTQYVSELKIGRKGTKVYLPGTDHLDIMKQIQVDIFCVDYLKVRNERINKLLSKVEDVLFFIKWNWDEKKLLVYHVEHSSKKFKKGYIFIIYLAHILRSFFGGEKNIEKIIKKMFIDDSQTSEYMGVARYYSKRWLEKDFVNLLMIDFNRIKMPIPKGYIKILTDQYGNYMELPPENQRYRNRFDEWIVEIEER